MKKILTCMLALFAAVSLYATDLNIYASGLKVTTSGGSTAGIQYTLNAPATSLDLKVLNGTSLVTTIAIPAGDANANFTKGTHNVNIDITDLAEGSYKWAIVANAAANGLSGLAEVEYPKTVDAYRYYLPQDVAVDNSFESQYFGHIYVSQSTVGNADGDAGSATTTNQVRGIYMYNADLTFTNGQDAALLGYDGNIGGNMTGSASRISFKRLAIDEQGYVYVGSRDATTKGVYRMDPSTPSAAFETILSASATVDALAIVGNTLLTFEGLAYSTASPGFIKTYSLASVPVIDAISSVDAYNSFHLGGSDCDVASDGRGGWWVTQHRWGADANPCLFHLTGDNENNYEVSSTHNSTLLHNNNTGITYRGVVAVNPAGNLLAVGSNKQAVVFSIEYDGEGVPTLTELYATPVLGTNIDGVAFDVANNLYVASASSERFYAYATPKAVNSFETPAPSASMIVRSSTITHVTGISLDQTSASIEKGHTLTLVATVVPGDATNPTVNWTSSNDEIATVSNSGVVTAVAEGGPVTITATTEDGGLTATCEITVFVNHVTSVTVEPTTLDLAPGFSANLTATVLPDEATDKSFVWESSDPTIATVENGLVTAVAVGDVTISAIANDGSVTGTCAVTVHPAVAHISAHGLAVTPTATGYNFSFKANMATDAAALVFYDKTNGDFVGELPIASVVSGNNVVSVNAFALPGTGQDMTWGVRLTGADNALFSKVYEASAITGRSHVAVDASPESPHFGQIYQFNRTAAVATSGLYVYDAEYNRSEIHKMGDEVVQGIMRLTVDASGIVWGIDYSDGHSGVYIMDPSDLSTYSQFYQGNRASSGLFTNGGEEVGGSGTGIFAYGSGENMKLYTIQEDMTGHGANPMAVYNVGTARTWDTAPSQVFTITGNANGNGCICVVEEGIWVSQNRSKGNNLTANPGLTFYAMDGTPLANFGGFVDLDGCNGSGMTVDPKHNKLYIVDGSSNICEFDIAYDALTNVPTLTLVQKHAIGNQYVSSMGLDYAGNLCVVAGAAYSNSGSMKLIVYSPATNGHNTTMIPAPAASIVKMTPVAQLYEYDTQSGDWALDAGTAMEMKEANIFTGTYEFTGADRYITFSTLQGASASDWEGIAAGRLSAVADGDNYWITGETASADFVLGGGKCYMVPAANAGKFQITVNFNTMKVEFVKVKAENVYGYTDASGAWVLSGLELTKVENNVFEGEFVLPEAKHILFSKVDADNWNDINAAQIEINSSNDYWVNGNSEATIIAAPLTPGEHPGFLIKGAGKYKFNVNLNTNKITITQMNAMVEVTTAGYATYYNSEKAYTMPDGMTGYAFNVANGLVEAYVEGDIVPYNTPLVLEAAAGTYDLEWATGGEVKDLASQLHGSDWDSNLASNTDYLFYGLSLAAAPNDTPTSVGFYWMAENGAAFQTKAHRAYLMVPVGSTDAPAILFNENNATNLNEFQGNDEVVKFIENGQLFIKKNGVVYDATGAVIRK